MNLPEPGDFIDIHNHGAKRDPGCFQIDNLMTHQERVPDNEKDITYSIGIHPWYLTETNFTEQLNTVASWAGFGNVIALGETGFDKLKGPAFSVQQASFREHVKIAEEVSKPLFIHCVRSWDELLLERKKLKPSTPWIIHGFRGSRELALQLLSKGFRLSFWFGFVLRPESGPILRNLPKENLLLETDGSGTDIRIIYQKVATDLGISVEELKNLIYSNFNLLFRS